MVEFVQQGEQCLVKGRLTQTDVSHLWTQKDTLLGPQTSELELSALEYSDSAGIAFLISLSRQGRTQHLRLMAPSPQLKKLIALYNLAAFFCEEAN
ncbi:STAS domain-containing protein [Shewanella sp. AS16]|uniref:STAS domain-containing protein n=1 Tax=Shewanella sp. AS16 TaxID=2907625 RepID=UPI001F3DF7DF|nr:STAS domain-containing protein [Shewanella sp. AS16]MCE9687077.1 STAS domain-containing protein [Shewanella sp. AS16]